MTSREKEQGNHIIERLNDVSRRLDGQLKMIESSFGAYHTEYIEVHQGQINLNERIAKLENKFDELAETIRSIPCMNGECHDDKT